MSFPYNNAHSVSMEIINIEEAAATTIPMLATGQHNMFSTPGVVDVSAMEASFALEQLSASALTRTQASAASTSVFTLSDGGASGDATGAAVLFSQDNWSNSLTSAFTLNKPIDATGTSTTDLDADDWVNFRVVANATGLSGAAIVTVNYVYGKPGGIA